MHGGGVNKLKTGVQILEMFQGDDLVLLTETWHFPNQQLPHVKRFDSLAVARTVQLGRTKAIKHSGGGLLLTFSATSAQTYHSGRKETMIRTYGYGSTRVLPLTCLSAWCTLPLLDLNTRANPCSKTWQEILLKTL
jgi:hypothetical protein